MNRRTKKIGSIFSKLESFVGYKYPTFIKDILLNTGFDCEHALKTIDEKTIPTIEKKIELNHPHLLNGTIYESKLDSHLPFEFLIGHRALILEIPSTLEKYLTRKIEKKVKNSKEIEPQNLRVLLTNKIINNLKKKNINCEFEIENIGEFTQKENRFTCLVKCVFCSINTPCSFDKYWRIGNYSNHVCGHKGKETPGLASGTSKNPLEPKQTQYHRAIPNVIYEVQNVLMR